MQITFICGCRTGNYEHPDNLKTMDSVGLDIEGFLVCKIHHERRYGWRSIPASNNHPGPKAPYLSMTALEIERRIIFKEDFPKKTVDLAFTIPITLDNRDPQAVGHELLARNNHHGISS